MQLCMVSKPSWIRVAPLTLGLASKLGAAAGGDGRLRFGARAAGREAVPWPEVTRTWRDVAVRVITNPNSGK